MKFIKSLKYTRPFAIVDLLMDECGLDNISLKHAAILGSYLEIS